MKQLSLALAILVLSFNTYSAVSSKELGAVDTVFEMTKSRCLEVINSAPESNNLTEGKLIASYITLLEDKMENIEQKLSSIDNTDDISESELLDIQDDIEELQQLIVDFEN